MTTLLFISAMILAWVGLTTCLIWVRSRDEAGLYRSWYDKPTNYTPGTEGYQYAPYTQEEISL